MTTAPLLLLATALALVVAQETVTPANFTASTANLKAEDGVTLLLSEGELGVPIAAVLPLTNAAMTPPPAGLIGNVRLINPSNDAVPTSSDVPFISCDSTPGYLSPLNSFNDAVQANVSAIVFYTTQGDYCNLQGYPENEYPWVYSMKSRNATMYMLKVANTPDPDDGGAVAAAIRATDQVKGGSGANNPHKSPLGPSPTTAVAMIILYSVTGVITILFLFIIMSGAIRAHRHPERYGPRNGFGHPRQSRAKGLARAMLDTLPIVKFSEREQPKPTDVELADQAPVSTMPVQTTETLTREIAHDTQPVPVQVANDADRSGEGGIAAATTTLEQSPSRDHQGCSICTEDFEEGQDQRVLPCDHRFHPECVDPWLLNVSGTCPLCRVDLRPALSASPETGLEDGRPGEADAPPLGPQDTAGERQRMTIRRSIMIGIMGGRRPDTLSREERLIALRELRGQRLVRQRREEQAAVAETPEEESRARRPLRGFLRRRPAP